MATDSEKGTALTLPDQEQFTRDIKAITEFQKIVHANMIDGLDFGVIPGTSKPTLLKPGAEKIAKLLGLADEYEIVDKQEDWSTPFFRYIVKCKLISVAHGVTISEGFGECNSMEAHYRWRAGARKCPACQREGTIIKGKAEYGGGWICFAKKGGCGEKWRDGTKEIEDQSTEKVLNDDLYSLVNTFIKMARKRALVDAALSAGRLSALFTQDREDPGALIEPETEEPLGVIIEGTPGQDKKKDGPQQAPPATKDLTPKEFADGMIRLGVIRLGIQPTIVAICNALEMEASAEKLKAAYSTRLLMLEALSKKVGKDWKPPGSGEEEVKSQLEQDKELCELAEKLGFSDVNADFIDFMKTRRRKWDSKVDPIEDQDVEKYRQNLQARASVKASVQTSQLSKSKSVCQGCGEETEEISTYKDMELCQGCYKKQSDKDEQNH